MMNTPYDYLRVTTKDGLRLSGLAHFGHLEKKAYLFIHGFTTDFYSHPFYHAVALALKESGNTFVLAQTRGTGLETEFSNASGKSVNIGSYFEQLEDAHLDISAFIQELASRGYGQVCLIGHSLGTLKAVRYLKEGAHPDLVQKLVLLAPFDKNAFLERKAPGSWQVFLDRATEMVSQGNGREIVPVPEMEDFPMSFQTFLSWYTQSDVNCIWDFYRSGYDFPGLKGITVPVKVILGDKDPFVVYPEFGVDSRQALKLIQQHIPQCETTLLEGCNHTFDGFESRIGYEVANG